MFFVKYNMYIIYALYIRRECIYAAIPYEYLLHHTVEFGEAMHLNMSTERVPEHLHRDESERLDFRVKATATFVYDGRKYLSGI